ncbi:hypothetical protein SAMN05421874_11721 [Nonomuraea maritima]|uniref:Uncharacterized protein n=1 Tax=Nonomuraea maritima TaxID=683260 RepID=A0A1G9HX84_9ACTN|nr:hypothetical protein [Nonomuraea maritima]SDL17435.1 hypothetical protein SAMN05421874_11721 [Nonomuraea maritima]
MIHEPAPSPTPDRQRAADALARPLETAAAAMNALMDTESILRNAEDYRSP